MLVVLLVNYNSVSINNSYATCSVIASGNYVGGLVGGNDSSSINNSYATGNVNGNNIMLEALSVIIIQASQQLCYWQCKR